MWLGDNGYIKSNCLGSISNKGVINIARKGYVYDKNGKRLKSYRGGKATVTRNQKIKYAGKLTETSRELYYYVGSGAYVKAKDVSQVAGKNVMFLKTNTYVYNNKGQRIKKQGTLVTYSGSVKAASSSDDFFFYPSESSNKDPQALKQYKIKGKVYYALGGGRYVKAVNVSKINGQYVFTKQPTYVIPRADMYVLLPQAFKLELPATINLATRVIKTTSILMLISVMDVINVGQQIIEANNQKFPTGVFWVYGLIFFFYFILDYPLSVWAKSLMAKQK